MKVIKYITNNNITILEKLFIEGDIIYISESIHTMDGVFSYSRKVFDENKNYLGRISDDYFEKKIKKLLKN